MAASRKVKFALWSMLLSTLVFFLILMSFMPRVYVTNFNANKLIVIIVDGLGQTQVQQLMKINDDTAFESIANHGVHAEFMRPVFPTMTLPNHYALLTGRYAEDHGVILDVIYNEKTKDETDFMTNPHLWLNNVKPVWMTALDKKYKVVMSTSQCHHPIPVLNITTSCNSTTKTPNEDLLSLEENLRVAYDRMVKVADVSFSIVHTSVVHQVVRTHGPTSLEVQEIVLQLDAVLGRFLHDVNSIIDQINVIVVSDAGLASTANKKPVLIQEILNEEDIEKAIISGAHLSLWPLDGRIDVVMESLRVVNGIRAFTKDSFMLEKLHYRNNGLIAPVQVVAYDDYYIQLNKTNSKFTGHSEIPKGLHGFDPFAVSEMKSVFFAQGPKFSVGKSIPYIHSTEIHNIICHVLLLNRDVYVREGILKMAKTHH